MCLELGTLYLYKNRVKEGGRGEQASTQKTLDWNLLYRRGNWAQETRSLLPPFSKFLLCIPVTLHCQRVTSCGLSAPCLFLVSLTELCSPCRCCFSCFQALVSMSCQARSSCSEGRSHSCFPLCDLIHLLRIKCHPCAGDSNICITNPDVGAGEMAPQMRTVAAFPEGPGLIPSTSVATPSL